MTQIFEQMTIVGVGLIGGSMARKAREKGLVKKFVTKSTMKSIKEKIMTIQGDVGAKRILELNEDKVLNVEINDSCITKDFNTMDNFNF